MTATLGRGIDVAGAVPSPPSSTGGGGRPTRKSCPASGVGTGPNLKETNPMTGPEQALKRLQYEAMDWARTVRHGDSGPLDSHRDSIQWHPEVWND